MNFAPYIPIDKSRGFTAILIIGSEIIIQENFKKILKAQHDLKFWVFGS